MNESEKYCCEEYVFKIFLCEVSVGEVTVGLGEVANCEVNLAKWVVGEVFVTYTHNYNIELD